MAKSTYLLKKYYKKQESITRQFAISSGRILIRYKSQVLYKDKFLTRYFPTYSQAKNHMKILLISDGKIKPTNILTYKRQSKIKILQLFKDIA